MIKVNNSVINVHKFMSGEQKINFQVVEDEVYNFEWFYENDAELVTLLFLTSHIKEKNGLVYDLLLYYCPNSRFDRVENEDEVFTLKYFSEIINRIGFMKVVTLSAHSDECLALIDNCYNTNLFEINLNDYSKNILIYYPDAGALARYNKENKKCIYGEKQRDWETGKITGLTIIGETPEEFDVIIIDDICSFGGTFYYSALELKKLGAKNITLCVTHCENSILEGSFGEDKVPLLETGLIDKVLTTNSIFTKSHPKIEVYDIRGGI